MTIGDPNILKYDHSIMAKFLLTNVKTADFCRATSLLPKCTRMHQSIIPRKIFRGNIPGYPHWVPYLREGKAGGKGRRGGREQTMEREEGRRGEDGGKGRGGDGRSVAAPNTHSCHPIGSYSCMRHFRRRGCSCNTSHCPP